MIVLIVVASGLGVPVGERGPSGAVAAPAAEEGAPLGPPDVLPADGRWTVTLLTGEVVEVQSDADGRVMARVREQTAPVRTVQVPGGDIFVTPLSVGALPDGLLDPELFNVTGLIRQGYDDASSDVVPLIVEREPGTEPEATLFGAGGRSLPSIGAVAVEVPKANTTAVGEVLTSEAAGSRIAGLDGAEKVWLDRQVVASSTPLTPAPRSAALDPNLTQVGADDAWAAGWTGEGVRVAVLDSGVDARHPDLEGQIVAEQNFSDSADMVDRIGHGTHVASLVGGSGTASGGARSGVAPGADLVIGKVLGDDGSGEASDLIAAMEWAAGEADVVNISLGADFASDGSDPVSTALDQLTDQHGTLFVVAAGNSGPASKSVGIPAAADRALTVGAVDGGDSVAWFSSRGPLAGSFELKPEVVAPGVDIVAARAEGTTLGEPVDATYVTSSGTSMAAPHVAGAAAVLAEQHPDWTGDQIRHALIGSAAPMGADGFDAGSGRIDLAAGIEVALHADRDVLDLSLAHPRTHPHVEDITWTNSGPESLTVTLSAALVDREGDNVDAASVTPTELTIAPGATGVAELRVDGPGLDAGLYSGSVTAQSPDGRRSRLPVGVHAGPELVDLTIEATAPAGALDPIVTFDVVDLDDFADFYHSGEFFGDATTIQVPKGRYAVVGAVTGTDFDSRVVAQVGDPDVTIEADTTVTFDGAGAVPLAPRVEGVDTAAPMHSAAFMRVTPSAGTGGFALFAGIQAEYPMPPVHLTPMEGDDRFSASQAFRLQAPHIRAEAGGSPLEVVTVPGAPSLPAGEHVLRAVDVGDGDDLSAAGGGLAVVDLPPDDEERRRAIVERAAEARVAALAFVDEQRSRLTLGSFGNGYGWATLPVIAVAGTSATSLKATAAAGGEVTIAVTASPYVYDITTADARSVDPAPVITSAEQADLAVLDERFHRDPDGRGPAGDVRFPISVSPIWLESEGPLPERRTGHVSPGTTWQSEVYGQAVEDWGNGPEVGRSTLSLDPGRRYAGGRRHTLTWLRRPQWPAPGSGRTDGYFCAYPVQRSADRLDVFLSAFQDGPDRESCSRPIDATLTLERDGTAIGTAKDVMGSFAIPADRGTYRLRYDQQGDAPYPHRSSTTWTFTSSVPDPAGHTVVPVALLTVEYQLPLDTLNRPTGATASLRVRPSAGESTRVDQPSVWTSTDDGTTWRRARVRRTSADGFDVRLPDVPTGTGVSLRVDARGPRGSRVEQTLFDAYTG